MTRSADLQPGEAELQTGLVALRDSQLMTRTSASTADCARRRFLVGCGDVTLRGQHLPGPAADVRLGGGDATLLATAEHRTTTGKTHRNSATRH